MSVHFCEFLSKAEIFAVSISCLPRVTIFSINKQRENFNYIRLFFLVESKKISKWSIQMINIYIVNISRFSMILKL